MHCPQEPAASKEDMAVPRELYPWGASTKLLYTIILSTVSGSFSPESPQEQMFPGAPFVSLCGPQRRQRDRKGVQKSPCVEMVGTVPPMAGNVMTNAQG